LASAQYQTDAHWLPISVCPEINDRAGRHCGDGRGEIAQTSERRAVDRNDHVTCFNSCVGCGAAGFGAVENRSIRNRHTQLLATGAVIGLTSTPIHGQHGPFSSIIKAQDML
jgi:hypothetical protein